MDTHSLTHSLTHTCTVCDKEGEEEEEVKASKNLLSREGRRSLFDPVRN